MDGAQLTSLGERILGGIAEADRLDWYDALNRAAGIFARETMCLTAETQITTVADQQRYPLPPSFISIASIHAEFSTPRAYIKYSDGTTTSFPVEVPYASIFGANQTEAQERPTCFAIDSLKSDISRIAGSATALDIDAATGGEAVLTDATASFTTTVEVRDNIHNHTSGSTGKVISVIDDTHLTTAMFGGDHQGWSTYNQYVIVPARTKEIVLDAPSESDGHTMTVLYTSMPAPVYSDYATWAFEERSAPAIAEQAAYLFKLGIDFNPKTDPMLVTEFRDEIRRIKMERARSTLRSYQRRMQRSY